VRVTNTPPADEQHRAYTRVQTSVYNVHNQNSKLAVTWHNGPARGRRPSADALAFTVAATGALTILCQARPVIPITPLLGFDHLEIIQEMYVQDKPPGQHAPGTKHRSKRVKA
jgi:hypothetical protein